MDEFAVDGNFKVAGDSGSSFETLRKNAVQWQCPLRGPPSVAYPFGFEVFVTDLLLKSLVLIEKIRVDEAWRIDVYLGGVPSCATVTEKISRVSSISCSRRRSPVNNVNFWFSHFVC